MAPLTAKEAKEFAKSLGADLVGVASMDRFESAPPEMDPRHIFPDAKSAIVLALRIPRGCFRGIEEGTYFAAMNVIGYGGINLVFGPYLLWRLTQFLEDHGYEAVPISNVDTRLGPGSGRPVAPGKPAPDIFVHLRLCAVAAGLGEIGYSKLLLTPQFGPRQRVAGVILTDAPLEPDPLVPPGTVCDRCKICVEECPAGAISRTETESTRIGEYVYEWGKLDEAKCTLSYAGGLREVSPFLTPELEREMSLSNPWGSILKIPYNRRAWDSVYHHPCPIEGAKGCIRACMAHLEEAGRISAKFVNPFRLRPKR